MVLSDKLEDFLRRQWDERDWGPLQWQQMYTLLDYTEAQAFEQGLPDPTTTVKEEFRVLDTGIVQGLEDPQEAYDVLKKELFDRLNLTLPSEAKDELTQLDWELDEVKAQRDALEELVEETPKAKRIKELERDLEQRESRVGELENKLEGLREEAREAREAREGEGKGVERGEIQELRASINRLQSRIEELQEGFEEAVRQAARQMREQLQAIRRKPRHKLSAEEMFERVKGRYPDMFIAYLKGELPPASQLVGYSYSEEQIGGMAKRHPSKLERMFKGFKSKIEELGPKTYGITSIKGIGPKIADELEDMGIDTLPGLVQADPEEIAIKIPRVSVEKARKFQESAGDMFEARDVKDRLQEWVEEEAEEKDPRLNAYKVWVIVRKRIDPEKSFEENKGRLKKVLERKWDFEYGP